MNKKSAIQFSKSALAISAIALAVSSAYADNVIYIGKAVENDIAALTIVQQGALEANSIGVGSEARFNVDGKWNSISITQASRNIAGTTGNVIVGAVKNDSSGSANTMTLVQDGDGNRIALAVGATTPSTGTVVLGISQTGSGNSSTYTMNNVGNVTVAETTVGNRNTVSVTSSGGTDYSNRIDLTGSDNGVTVTRTGAFTSSVDHITLLGNLNSVVLTGSAAGTNAVTLDVTGNSNYFGVNQTGASSVANIVVATSLKTFNVTQATANARFSLTGTLTSGGSVSITQ